MSTLEAKTMKKLFAIAILLASTAPVTAQTLSEPEKAVVVSVVVGSAVAAHCGATVVRGGMDRFADKIGVDGDRIIAAVSAAVAAQVQPYDREKLIPAVTRLMLDTEIAITEGLQRDKAKTCASFMKNLRENGVVE
jgi:hypothetical protein